MASLDLFRVPVSESSPSGVDLRNDIRFHALERQLLPATRAARRQTPDSDPAVDWAELLEASAELAREGRDLRLLTVVVRCLAQTEEFRGLSDGLDLLTYSVEQYWPNLHPELRDRPSPKEAAVRRISAVMQMQSDEDGLLCDLHHKAFLTIRGFGRITGGELALAAVSRHAMTSELPAGVSEAQKAALLAEHETRAERVRTACRALAAEQAARLAELREGLDAARAALGRLEAALSSRVAENGVGVSLPLLSRLLDRMSATLGAASAGDAAQPAAGAAEGVAGPAAAVPAGPAAIGAVTSRSDVERMLDRIIEFYERAEPASPIPLLARRMRRMVPMSFLQLMEEMAPSGLKEVRSLTGASDEKAK